MNWGLARGEKPDVGGRDSSTLRNVGGLGSFLTLGDFEFYLVAFLQAFVAFRSDRAVVHKDIGAICTPYEPVAFGVVEPLNRSFQTFHARPSFRTSFWGAKDVPELVGCILER